MLDEITIFFLYNWFKKKKIICINKFLRRKCEGKKFCCLEFLLPPNYENAIQQVSKGLFGIIFRSSFFILQKQKTQKLVWYWQDLFTVSFFIYVKTRIIWSTKSTKKIIKRKICVLYLQCLVYGFHIYLFTFQYLVNVTLQGGQQDSTQTLFLSLSFFFQ